MDYLDLEQSRTHWLPTLSFYHLIYISPFFLGVAEDSINKFFCRGISIYSKLFWTLFTLVHCIWYLPTLMKISNMDIFSTTNKAFTVIFIICELCTPKTIITSYIMSIFSEVSLTSQLLFSVINYREKQLWS